MHFCIADIRRSTSRECRRKKRQVPAGLQCWGVVVRHRCWESRWTFAMQVSVCTMETFCPSKPAGQKWQVFHSLPKGRFCCCWQSWLYLIHVLEEDRRIFTWQLWLHSRTCSGPVEAGRRRQAATAPWYEGVSELFRVTPLPTVVGYAVARPSLLPLRLWKRTITPQQIPRTVFPPTELTGIKRVWPLLSQFTPQLFWHRLHFWLKTTDCLICQRNSTNTMH